MKLSEVYEGWRNDLIPPEHLKEVIKEVSSKRMKICKACIAYSPLGEGCTLPGTAPCCNNKIVVDGEQGCGCPLKKKTKCLLLN